MINLHPKLLKHTICVWDFFQQYCNALVNYSNLSTKLGCNGGPAKAKRKDRTTIREGKNTMCWLVHQLKARSSFNPWSEMKQIIHLRIASSSSSNDSFKRKNIYICKRNPFLNIFNEEIQKVNSDSSIFFKLGIKHSQKWLNFVHNSGAVSEILTFMLPWIAMMFYNIVLETQFGMINFVTH